MNACDKTIKDDCFLFLSLLRAEIHTEVGSTVSLEAQQNTTKHDLLTERQIHH